MGSNDDTSNPGRDERRDGSQPTSEQPVAWEAMFREQLNKHPDPASFQEKILKILTDMIVEPGEDGRPRAIDAHDERARSGFLTMLFGDSVRVKLLEALLRHPEGWFNVSDLATIAGVGKASVSRVIDEIEASGVDLIERDPVVDPGKERLVKLKSTQLTREIRFFYMKIRGIL